MHRSATSLVARTLSSEVHMGEILLMGLPDNPKGHYENLSIIDINERILTDAGGDWYDPPPRDAIIEVGKKYKEKIKKIVDYEVSIARSKNLESWGFKDPRTCLTIDVWYKYLPNPQFVVCYRSIDDIAISLHKRDGLPIENCKALTKEYNNRIMSFMKNLYG